MSYVTYTTEALVCGSFDQNTADRSFLLFTKELGMLFAVAKSVREERSLQRPALQDFSRIRVSLVKGKTGWRIGSVESHQNDFYLAIDRETRGSVVALYRLLRRFIRGEEASVELYDFVVSALDAVLKPEVNRAVLDLFIQLKVLSLLGYVDEDSMPAAVKDMVVGGMVMSVSPTVLAQMEVLVAKATENSHL